MESPGTNNIQPEEIKKFFSEVSYIISDLIKKVEKLENKNLKAEEDFTEFKIEYIKHEFELKEKVFKEIQELSLAITILQQKFLMIAGVASVVVSIIITVISKIITGFVGIN
jgi:hypothetical protein